MAAAETIRTQSAKPPTLRLRSGVGGDGGQIAALGWQPKKASAVWTQQEFTNLCQHLHNDNPPHHFVMATRNHETGEKKYCRAKKLTADRAIEWAWASIAKSPRNKLAFVPYSTNERQESRWAGLDFDAHHGEGGHGEGGRAREFAFGAFRLLLDVPEVSVILETTGSGGWHVWAVSERFHPICDWIKLLKSVADKIGAPIAAGICELYPPDSLPSRFGKGLRAPGCWNPSTDTLSEIVWQNISTSLGSVLSGKSKSEWVNFNGLQSDFPDIEKKDSFSVPSLSPSSCPNQVLGEENRQFSQVSQSPEGGALMLYRESDFLLRFGIRAPRSRNGKLCDLVGELFHQVSHATARKFAEMQFVMAAVKPNSTLADHLKSFEALWDGLLDNWRGSLSPAERQGYESLTTDNERDCFRIMRSFARFAASRKELDFPFVRDNVALRLGISDKGAGGIRDKFAALGIIQKTRDYLPNKAAARYRWLLNCHEEITPTPIPSPGKDFFPSNPSSRSDRSSEHSRA